MTAIQLDTEGFPLLNQFSDEGFVDCVFRIEGLKSDRDFHYFNLFARYKDKKVGFAVKLVRVVGPGLDEEMKLINAHVYHLGVCFRSLGRVSDDLVSALGELYELDVGATRMVPEETFTMIALQKENTDLTRHVVRMKLFGRDDDPLVEDDYYESFFNVDIPGGFVFWNEKDPDYRAPLMKAMSAV